MDLFEEFSQLVLDLESEGVDYALCGGLAMAVYAFPRATLDIDVLIEKETLERVKGVARRNGFSYDAGLMRFLGGAVQIHRMTKVVPGSEDVLALDMVLVTPDLAEVWSSKREAAWAGGGLPVVSPEGLIQMKRLRGTSQDRADIEKLESLLDGG